MSEILRVSEEAGCCVNNASRDDPTRQANDECAELHVHVVVCVTMADGIVR